MKTVRTLMLVAVMTLAALPACLAAEIPESFPQDIALADFMMLKSVMDIRGNFRVNLHTRKPLNEVVGWFKTEMAKEGWALDENQITSENHATLQFHKDGRICAVVVTDAVLNVSGKMDETTRGITIHTAMKPLVPAAPPVKR